MMPQSTVVLNDQQTVKEILRQPISWMVAFLCLVVEGVVTAIDALSNYPSRFFALIIHLLQPHHLASSVNIYSSISFSLPSPPPDRIG